MLISRAERTSSARRSSMRLLELATTALALTPAAVSCASPTRTPERVVDLSHPFDADTIF